ncbi:hypothetical protein P154DRAFT_560077 [Amniculicola lignicola CBS 123094]|uniref:Uncharacterized protein n=1 Tax=Amniculicola lignicola CBS 123094 TaxID=1392246 RepID=A0A6A5WTH4_9PLEO|nr:hypothetical protein P154DRAFT_560077 [Amniculicola lignicola CBS 123094]
MGNSTSKKMRGFGSGDPEPNTSTTTTEVTPNAKASAVPNAPELKFLSKNLEDPTEHKDLPPPYNSTVPLPAHQRHHQLGTVFSQTQAAKVARKEGLQRYIMEILVFTFSADAHDVDNALGTVNGYHWTTSVLTAEERAELYDISMTINLLKDKASNNGWNTTQKEDRELIYFIVSQPTKAFRLREAYMLDLLATYKDHQCNEQLRHHTLVGHWQSSRGNSQKRELGMTLGSHAYVIGKIAPNENVRHVLGAAVERFQSENQITGVKFRSYESPIRDGFDSLESALRSEFWLRIGRVPMYSHMLSIQNIPAKKKNPETLDRYNWRRTA